MLRRIRRQIMPITLSKGLEIVARLSNSQTKTKEWYTYSVNNFIDFHGDLPATAVTKEMVTDWSKSLDTQINIRGQPFSEYTKNSYRRAVRAFFNKLVKTGHIDYPGPTGGMKVADPPQNEPRHLTEEEIERIRKFAQGDIRNHAIVELLYETGCRISEIGTMKVSNLHIQRSPTNKKLSYNELAVLELAEEMRLQHMLRDDLLDQYKGKILVVGKGQNGKQRVRWCYFGDEAARALKAYIDIRPHDAPDEIFLNASKGTPLTRFGLHHILKKIFKDAGVEARTHDIRHTFAKRLIKNGADLKVVSRLMGHSDTKTTLDIYYNFTDDELWDAHEEFS